MPAERAAYALSGCCIAVVWGASRSISPDYKAVRRCCEVGGTALNLEASPKVAAATALHKSTSSPCHCPLASGAEKPAKPVVTPHWTSPRFWTTSSVPACAIDAAPNKAAVATAYLNLCITFPCEKQHAFGRILLQSPPGKTHKLIRNCEIGRANV